MSEDVKRREAELRSDWEFDGSGFRESCLEFARVGWWLEFDVEGNEGCTLVII